MSWLIGIMKEGMLTFAALILIWILLDRVQLKKPKISFTCCIFSLYLAAVWMFVGMPDLLYIRLDVTGNLVPFRGMVPDLRNCVLNILLFLPLGFLLPVLRNEYRKARKTVGIGIGISGAIEVLQIFTYRATDINDLITNSLGAALGFLLWKLLPAKKESLSSEGNLFSILLGITVCVMFFLHPFLYRLSWSLF